MLLVWALCYTFAHSSQQRKYILKYRATEFELCFNFKTYSQIILNVKEQNEKYINTYGRESQCP